MILRSVSDSNILRTKSCHGRKLSATKICMTRIPELLLAEISVQPRNPIIRRSFHSCTFTMELSCPRASIRLLESNKSKGTGVVGIKTGNAHLQRLIVEAAWAKRQVGLSPGPSASRPSLAGSKNLGSAGASNAHGDRKRSRFGVRQTPESQQEADLGEIRLGSRDYRCSFEHRRDCRVRRRLGECGACRCVAVSSAGTIQMAKTGPQIHSRNSGHAFSGISEPRVYAVSFRGPASALMRSSSAPDFVCSVITYSCSPQTLGQTVPSYLAKGLVE